MDNASHNFQVVFSGTIQHGKNLNEVKQALAASMRVPVEKIGGLFSGRKLILKRTTTLEQAQAFVRALARAGAIAVIETAQGKPVEPAADPVAGTLQPLPRDSGTLPPFRPFPANFLFKPALAIATAIELLLTLLYVVLLAGGILLLFYHTLVSGWLFEAIPVMALAALLSAVMFIAGTLFLFLLAKPLLGFIRRKEPEFEVSREIEPEFYNYVAEIAALVGTTPPVQIRVNNSAMLTLRPVWRWHGLIHRDKQLTVGLTLLAGLNSKQMAALLAQGLHSWRPGFVSFMGQLLEGTIRWLHRAGYDSDIVDRKLQEWQQRFVKQAPLLEKIARFASWSAKPALWRLGFSRFLSRRLVHRLIANRDIAARQIAGSEDLQAAMSQSRLLAFAAQNTLPELKKMWESRGELPDNIATAVVARASHYPSQIHAQLNSVQERHLMERGRFLPSDAQRLAYAGSDIDKGVYQISAPCSVFFLRLEKLMHIMTVRYYHAHLHIPVTTNKLVRVAVKGSREYEADARIARFFGKSFADFVPLRLNSRLKSLPASVHDLALKWREAVARLIEEQARTASLAVSLRTVDDDLIEVSNREILQRAGVGSALTGFSIRNRGDSEEIQQQCRDGEAAYEKAIAELDKCLSHYAVRLSTALALLNTTEVRQKIPNAGKLFQEVEQLLGVHEKIENSYAKLRELRMHVILLESLLSYEEMKSTPKLRDRIRELADDIRGILTSFGVIYKQVPYPFNNEEHYRNLFDWVQAQSAKGEGAPADFDRGNDAVRRMALMQRLIVGRLADIAVYVESGLGLKPGSIT